MRAEEKAKMQVKGKHYIGVLQLGSALGFCIRLFNELNYVFYSMHPQVLLRQLRHRHR